MEEAGSRGRNGHRVTLTVQAACVVSRLPVLMRKVVKAVALCVSSPPPVCHLTLLHPSTPRFRTFCAADRSVNFSTQLKKKKSLFLICSVLHM